jgi:hypothetical protein
VAFGFAALLVNELDFAGSDVKPFNVIFGEKNISDGASP